MAGGAILAMAAVVLAGCSTSASNTPLERSMGYAYAGPVTLKIRKDIDLRSADAAVVNHGDRLTIIKRRRRFVFVRTASGVEGWTDIRQLLSPAQMGAMDQLAEAARRLPSQGAATVYEPLNVHTEPNRMAPSFYRIKEREQVDVVDYRTIARVPFDPKPLLPPTPPAKARARKKPETSRVPPPPRPPAPKLPPDWEELSKTPPSEEIEPPNSVEKEEPEPAKDVPLDEWALVRLGNGRAGWVLTGMLRMSIPDDVAQYSEGHRITSYFSMGEVNDGGQIKHHWLWTTLGKTKTDYQFDSFRIFIWNARKHRYETAYIEKNLRGYFPVEVQQVNVTAGRKQETAPGFSLIVEDDNGVRWRRTYACQLYRVSLAAKQQVERNASTAIPQPGTGLQIYEPPQPAAQPKPGFMDRIKDLKRRIFGGK